MVEEEERVTLALEAQVVLKQLLVVLPLLVLAVLVVMVVMVR